MWSDTCPWTELGFGDTCALTIATDLRAAGINAVRTESELAAVHALPPWLGDEAVHRSHQSALVRKDREHYAPLFPGVPDDLAYVWPVRSASVVAAEQRKADNVERRKLRQSERAKLKERRSGYNVGAAVPRSRPGRRGDRPLWRTAAGRWLTPA